MNDFTKNKLNQFIEAENSEIITKYSKWDSTFSKNPVMSLYYSNTIIGGPMTAAGLFLILADRYQYWSEQYNDDQYKKEYFSQTYKYCLRQIVHYLKVSGVAGSDIEYWDEIGNI